jgi:hypothetical protein
MLLESRWEAIMRGMSGSLKLLVCCVAMPLAAQTMIDRQGNQLKNLPVKLGSSLPAICTQGDLFFVTVAPAGSNLYGCTAGNTWSVLGSGGGSGGGPGTLTIASNGTVVGTRGIANFLPGTGILNLLADTGTMLNIQQSVDTAVVLTRGGHQSGQTLLCGSASGSGSNFTCAMSPTLTGYQRGMVLEWTPDVDGAGGAATLNIDLLGAKAIKLADGVTDPFASDIAGGRLQPIWFDGVNFRLIAPVMTSASSSARPACNAAIRGRTWTALGGTGIKDEVAVCAKDAADSYNWRVLY